jgi:hypothetical protein
MPKKYGSTPRAHWGMVVVNSYGGDDQHLKLEGSLGSNPKIIVNADLARMFTATGECSSYGLRYGETKRKLGIFPIINWINIDNGIQTTQEFFDKYKSVVEKFS